MPNHWDFLLRPAADGELTAFLSWLTHTHTQRWHAHYHTAGTRHLYQERFRACPIQEDDHLYTVLRYVERNALRAKLVRRAEYWRWSSLWRRHTSAAEKQAFLHPWPLPLPKNWLDYVNRPETEAELAAMRRSAIRGTPFGAASWTRHAAIGLGLEYALRPRGRPSKKPRNR